MLELMSSPISMSYFYIGTNKYITELNEKFKI